MYSKRKKEYGEAAETAPNEPQTLSSPTPGDKGHRSEQQERRIWGTKLEETGCPSFTVHWTSHGLVAQANTEEWRS